MAVLTITGDIKRLETIVTSNRLVAKKYGLEMSLKDDNKEGGSSPLENDPKPSKRGPKPKADK
jgi:hypothetical protein